MFFAQAEPVLTRRSSFDRLRTNGGSKGSLPEQKKNFSASFADSSEASERSSLVLLNEICRDEWAVKMALDDP